MKYYPYIPKKAVMIDAETLDKIPSSIVLSFAGLIFEPLGCKQQLVDADDKVIAPNINIVFEYTEGQAHRSKSPSTIKWWSEQSAEAKAGVFSDKLLRVEYETAVRRFYDWLAQAKAQGAEAIFACSPRFDVGILEDMVRDVYGKDENGEYYSLPIPFFAEIDVRSIRGFVFGKKKINWGVKHEALGDCVRQSLEMQEAYAWRNSL
jgi:hypothetical protein